jgi:hypothetical protein
LRGTPDEFATPPLYIASDLLYWEGLDLILEGARELEGLPATVFALILGCWTR